MTTNKFQNLSRTEMEIIEELERGYSSKRIAESLQLSTDKVKTSQNNICRKLKLKSTRRLYSYVKHIQTDMYERIGQ